MNLAVDIGNTQIKFGLFQEDTLIKVFRYPTEEIKSEHLSLFIRSLRKEFPDIKKGILCSVVQLNHSFLDEIQFLNPLHVFLSSSRINFSNLYASPDSLGLDRMAAVSGSLVENPSGNSLIINAGTCITYDFINENREYLGGAISPGFGLRSKALHTFTSKLPLIDLRLISDTPYMGKTTTECIQAGIIWAVIHEVKGFIEQYLSDHPGMKIILAGGDANFLDTHLKNTIFAHQIKWMPDLVLIGLNRILKIQDA